MVAPDSVFLSADRRDRVTFRRLSDMTGGTGLDWTKTSAPSSPPNFYQVITFACRSNC